MWNKSRNKKPCENNLFKDYDLNSSMLYNNVGLKSTGRNSRGRVWGANNILN
jgi:hypothetical protein